MKHLRLWMLLGAAILCFNLPDATVAQTTFEGRPFTLVLPDITPPRATVVVLHGARGSGERVRASSGFDAWAKRYEVATVYPTGEYGWNDGRGASRFIPTTADDVGYLTRLLGHLHQSGQIPERAAYFMGISNGGGMTLRMACEQPDVVRGISIIATKEFPKTRCPAYAPVPTVFFLGTADALSPHAGNPEGHTGPFKQPQPARYSAAQTLERAAKRNGCGGRTVDRMIDTDPNDGTEVLHQSFQSCTAPLEYYEIINGGHTWPGTAPAKRRIARRILGNTSQDINANDITLRLWFGAPD